MPVSDRLLPPEGNPIIKDPIRRMKGQWTVFVLTWVAWILACVSVFSCKLLRISIDRKEAWTDMPSFGLFRMHVMEKDYGFEGCVSLPSDTLEGGYKSGRAFGIFLMIGITTAFLLMNAMTLFVKIHFLRRLMYLGVRICAVFALLSNLMMFTVFSNQLCDTEDARCPPGPAGIVAIVNSLVLITLSVLVFIIPCPNQCAFRWDFDMEVARTQTPPPEPVKTSTAEKMYRKSPGSASPTRDDAVGENQLVARDSEGF